MSHLSNLEGYHDQWSKLTLKDICPSVKIFSTELNAKANGKASESNRKKESTSFYQVIDVLSEGEIAGVCDKNGDLIYLSNDTNKNSDYFKGIYLNDNPVKNTKTNTYNYRTIFSEIRLGTENQKALSDLGEGLSFSKACQTFNYGSVLFGNNFDQNLKDINLGAGISKVFEKVGGRDNHNYGYPYDSCVATLFKPDCSYSEFSFVHTVLNNYVDSVVVNMSFSGQYSADSGDTHTVSTAFVIEVGYEGDNLSLNEGGSLGYITCFITGVATSEYTRSYHIPLPSFNGKDYRYIKVTRIDTEFSPSFVKGSKSLSVGSIVENINEKLTYPHTSLIASVFDASAFAQIPRRSYDLKLLKVRVPSNYDPESRVYTGNWNGVFAPNKQWTDNPAWALYDIVTNNRYGLGKYAFQQSMLDKWNLYSIAKHCDELLPTGNEGLQDPISFSVDSESTIFEITIDSTNTQSKLQSIFELGSKICFIDLQDSSGNDLNLNYQGIIKKTYVQNSIFKFEMIKDFGVDKIFFNYPELKKAYLFQREPGGSKNESGYSSPKKWLLDIIIDNKLASYLDSSKVTTFKNSYYQSYSFDAAVSSGSVVRQYSGELPILEPRFSCNIVFNNRDEAINTINNIAAIFRGITYWSDGLIHPSIDKNKDPVMIFNNSNVANGSFSYTGSAKTSRTSSVVVRYNDAYDNFKTKIAYSEDYSALRKFGYNENEVVALGVTSRSQARRMAKWILFTNQTETDVIQFSTGQEGSFLLPGDIISIQDNFKSTKKYGGRITSIDYAARSLTLDKAVVDNVVGQNIYIIAPKATSSSKELSKLAKNRENSSNQGISDTEIDNQRASQIKTFTIASVTDNNVITISETDDFDFNLITNGTIWSIENLQTGFNVKPIKYRVLSSEEKALNEFQITAMMYNSTKFDSLERDRAIENTQQPEPFIYTIDNFPSGFTPISDDFNIKDANIQDQIYDAYYTADSSENDIKAEITFDVTNLPIEVRGFVVEFFVLGKILRFSLDGRDNNSFSVFLGNRQTLTNAGQYIGYNVYVYDKDFKLEQLNFE